MRNRLERIKTTYNQYGDYDQELYFNQQKQIYKREIDFIEKMNAITDEQFTLKPLQISFLSSSALKDEQKFKDIKKILQEYNKNIIQNGGNAQNSVHFKKVIMESMLKFMRLMLLAPDTATKKKILDIAYHWFIRHLDPKSGRKTSSELQRQIRQIIVQKQLLPIQMVNRQLIINRVNQQLLPYKLKARTMYNQLDDPKLQLHNYNTHKLQFTNSNTKEAQQKNKTKKWIDTVKFPKIQPLAYEVEPVVEDKTNEQQNKKIDTTGSQQLKPILEGQQGKQVKLDAEGKPIPQQVKRPENINDQTQQDLDFGEPQDNGQAEPQEYQQQPDQKRRGKLDPLLKMFVLQRLRNKDRKQISCDKIREKQINKNNLIYQQDMLNADYLRQWARKRARLKSQIAKKSQSTRGTDKIFRAKHGQYSQYIENDIDRIRIKKTTEQHKRNITMIQSPQDKLNAQQSLSIFDRRRVRTEASHKPFSSILSEFSRKAQQNRMLTQIQEIKEKFSKYKLFTPMDKLIKGLAPPDDEYSEDNEKIIWPNSQMLSNPFIKVSKKKKKKKKKK